MSRTLIVSSSCNPESRSNRLAVTVHEILRTQGHEATQLQLSDIEFPDVNAPGLFESDVYLQCQELVSCADALILASPVYNWSISAELKKFIEVIGSTDAAHPSPFFDKLVSFIFAAGLPHSYMVLQSAALPLMLDFKCIINPHYAYLHNRHWSDADELIADGRNKITAMLEAHIDLSGRLMGYRQTGNWSV